jgi:ATP-dependent Clp protease adaptor protein ClpS
MTTDTIEKKKTITTDRIKEPDVYKVIILNDDVTTMEFVVYVFMTIFRKNQDESVALTMRIHNEGSAVAGIYTYEIAEQKSIDAMRLAQENGFPLTLKLEAA